MRNLIQNDGRNTIPNDPMTPAALLVRARELDVPGVLVSRGRRTETRAYAVLLENGEIMMSRVNAAPELHYTGRA
jgi:hypothetical protein